MPSQRWLRGPGRWQACRLGQVPKRAPMDDARPAPAVDPRVTGHVCCGCWRRLEDGQEGREGLCHAAGARLVFAGCGASCCLARRGLLPSVGAACTASDPCRKSPACDGENTTAVREHREGWLEFFFFCFFIARERGKLSLPEGKRAGKTQSPPLPAAPGHRASEKRVLGGLFQESRLLPPGPDSAEVGVQQMLIRWEPQSCLKTNRALRKIPGLQKSWVKTWV